MWCNGRKFCIKQLDETRKTSDSGITTLFWVTNVSSRSDKHPREFENRYYGYLNDIFECDLNSFKLVMFNVKCYRLQMHECDEERTVNQHANRFMMIKKMVFERGHDHYVFPSQCGHVFYSNVPGERDWSFVVRYDPRGSPIKYTHVQEEDDSPYQTEPEDHPGSTNEEDGEDRDPGIGDNAVLDDDVDEICSKMTLMMMMI
jgi:hypothetical protein